MPKGKLIWTAVAIVGGVAAIEAGIVLALPTTPPVVPELEVSGCEYSELETEGDVWKAQAQVVSPSGEYIAGHNPDGVARWGPGGETTLAHALQDELGEDGDDTTVHAVNSQGVVVGTQSHEESGEETPWKYDDGEVTKLKAPDDLDLPEEASFDVSISDTGDIVGTMSSQDSDFTSIGLQWKADKTKATVLDSAGDEIKGLSINHDGAAVGIVGKKNHEEFVKEGGEIRKWGSDGRGESLSYTKKAHYLEAAAGDWLVVTTIGSGAETRRWNMAMGGGPEKLRMPDIGAAGIDQHGRVYGLKNDAAGANHLEDYPSVEDATDIDHLPLGEHPFRDNKTYDIDAVSAKGNVIIGHRNELDDLDQGKVYPVVWRCD